MKRENFKTSIIFYDRDKYERFVKLLFLKENIQFSPWVRRMIDKWLKENDISYGQESNWSNRKSL